jgi:putative transposase
VWHLDEVVVTIGGRKHWLWRAVDQDGYVLDEIVQSRRNTTAAKRLLVRLMKKQGCLPKRIVTDKLRSYGAARRQVMPTVEHRELASAFAKTRAGHAGISVAGRVAKIPVRLFGGPKSLRSASLETLSPRQPSASPQGDCTLEGHCRRGRLIQEHLSQNTLGRFNLTEQPIPPLSTTILALA